MQKLLIIFALFFSHFFQTNAQKDKLDQLFEKYQEADGVTSIKIAKPMFNMLNKLNIADDELSQIKPLLSKINGLKILIVEKPKVSAKPEDQGKQMQFQKLQSDITTSLKNMKYEELMTVNSKDNKIKFLSSEATNGILDDLLLSINAEGNTVLLMLDGKISMDDVNNLINEAQNSAPISTLTSEKTNSTEATQVRNVGPFSGISVSGGIKVNFTQGNNQSVFVDTDSDKQKYVLTEVKNGILMISVDYKKNLNFKKLLVTVEAPELSAAKVSSGSLFTSLNTINTNDFTVQVSSGANVNADLNVKNTTNVDISSGSSITLDVNTKNFEFEGSSGSSATIRGNAESTFFNSSSASSCNAQSLVAKNGNATASSGSTIKMNITESLTGSASSGASIRYVGNPLNGSKDAKMSSGGTIKPLN
jgi:hypothetical protein